MYTSPNCTPTKSKPNCIPTKPKVLIIGQNCIYEKPLRNSKYMSWYWPWSLLFTPAKQTIIKHAILTLVAAPLPSSLLAQKKSLMLSYLILKDETGVNF